MMNKVFYELVRTSTKGRWNGIQRNYGPDEVHRLRSGVQIEYTLAVSILVKFREIFVK
jgi:isocitrate lyase